MKATESPLVDLLNSPLQFVIPIYQRAYSWTEEQCAQLWEDVERVATRDDLPAHFIGSVVYIKHDIYHATTLPQLLVIDGQQRLTTVSLMIEALARRLESAPNDSEEITTSKLRNYHLFNAYEAGDLRYKLQLSERDAPTLRAVLDAKELPAGTRSRVNDNFEYLCEKVNGSDLSPQEIYGGISKLLVVDVALERGRDNPQLIFESLNSTGLDLSQSDLIRNFVLMGLEPIEQEEMFKEHWQPMEQALSAADRADAFDRFLRAWLTLKLGEVPNSRRLYEAFKRHRALLAEQPISELLQDMQRNSRHYACIALGQETVPELTKAFEGLKALRVDAPMPFLLHVYELWQAGTLLKADIVQVLRWVESWLFRRAVCDVPSNVLSRTFATLPTLLQTESLVEHFGAWLQLRTRGQRFPRDEEFRGALEGRNLYEFGHRQYCLTRLENDGRKEPVDMGQYTIEHVLPQNENLSAEWRAMLGADWQSVQEHWLHTLGNLTLTGYNPELSDRPFAEKRDMEGGFADSPIRLNRGLAKLEAWNAGEIKKRATVIADKATSIWPAPLYADDIVAKYKKEPQGKGPRPRESLGHFKMSKNNQELYSRLLEHTTALGLEPIIWKNFIGIGLPGAGKPYPLAVVPRKNWLRLRFPVSFDELESPPACAYPHKSWSGRTCADVRTAEELDASLELLRFVPRLAFADLADGPSDDLEDE